MAIDPGIPTDFIGCFIPKPSSYASDASGIQGALHRLPGSHRIICCNSLRSEAGYSRVLTKRKNGTEMITGRRTTHII
jgi:hypothetical protein